MRESETAHAFLVNGVYGPSATVLVKSRGCEKQVIVNEMDCE